MELHTLTPAPGSVKKAKRIGRGPGSGRGGTSTRGHKGAKSRSGYSRKTGFEGGQMPLQRRVPKFGFKNPHRVEYAPINISTLESLAATHNLSEITPETLVQHGLVARKDLIKILGKGEVSRAINVKAHKFSAKAKEAIEAKGGKIDMIAVTGGNSENK